MTNLEKLKEILQATKTLEDQIDKLIKQIVLLPKDFKLLSLDGKVRFLESKLDTHNKLNEQFIP